MVRTRKTPRLAKAPPKLTSATALGFKSNLAGRKHAVLVSNSHSSDEDEDQEGGRTLMEKHLSETADMIMQTLSHLANKD